MNSRSDIRRRLAAALVFAALAGGAATAQEHHGHAPVVRDFDAATWAQLLHSGPRPAAYVFTTTYCSTCPAVFEQLHAYLGDRRKAVELVAVVMDEQGDRALRHAHHYAGITRLYAFNGFEPEIRHAVDPTWRNITPYVVLIDAQGRDQRVIGAPDAVRLRRWLPHGRTSN